MDCQPVSCHAISDKLNLIIFRTPGAQGNDTAMSEQADVNCPDEFSAWSMTCAENSSIASKFEIHSFTQQPAACLSRFFIAGAFSRMDPIFQQNIWQPIFYNPTFDTLIWLLGFENYLKLLLMNRNLLRFRPL